jgi:hypothetical protein
MQPTCRDCVELCGEERTKANTLLLEFFPSSDRQDLCTVPFSVDTTGVSYDPIALSLSATTGVFGPERFLFSLKIYQYPTIFSYYWFNQSVPSFEIHLNITSPKRARFRVSVLNL